MGILTMKGQITFKGVDLLKKQKEKLLDNITFQINNAEKVAFIGNSKQYILDLLLRGSEYSGENSEIKINDIEIRKINIQELRNKIAFVPKNQLFVTGTLRINIDPLNEYSVKEIFDVLELCQLKSLVEQFPDLLQTHIINVLEKINLEQRYFIQLARALLKGSKLLILDEPPISLLTNQIFTSNIWKRLSQTTVLIFTNKVD